MQSRIGNYVTTFYIFPSLAVIYFNFLKKFTFYDYEVVFTGRDEMNRILSQNRNFFKEGLSLLLINDDLKATH